MSAYCRQRHKKPPFSGEGRCVLNPSGLVSGLRAGLRLDRSRETRPVAPSPRPGRPLLLIGTFIGLQVHRYARVLRGGKSSPPTSPTTKTFCRGRRASGDLTRMAPATGRRAVSGYKTCLRAAKPPNTEYHLPCTLPRRYIVLVGLGGTVGI